MGCYRFENKSTGIQWIIFWVFLVTLSGAPIIYFAIMLSQVEALKWVDQDVKYSFSVINKSNSSDYLFNLWIVLASCIIGAGLFGMLFKWMRNRCCTVIYGTCLLPLWMITFAMGAVAVIISYTATQSL